MANGHVPRREEGALISLLIMSPTGGLLIYMAFETWFEKATHLSDRENDRHDMRANGMAMTTSPLLSFLTDPCFIFILLLAYDLHHRTSLQRMEAPQAEAAALEQQLANGQDGEQEGVSSSNDSNTSECSSTKVIPMETDHQDSKCLLRVYDRW